ncbi:hypothetical protein [Sphingomonas bacterium]|uniref:hypothetical protein n=1 Tax=Sphingomonas bacterium TaxID=1895847 RepID=UPI0015769FCA|nr:hypothetical protein [Sphingomonas bacterium]
MDYHADGGQTVTINDRKNGNITAEIGSSAKMPTDLPAWVPAYPGSAVMMAQNQNLKSSGGPVENVMLQTSDSLAKVAAFYDAKIAQAGLKPMHTVSSDDVSTRMVDTPDGMISVAASKVDDGGTTISITRMPKT